MDGGIRRGTRRAKGAGFWAPKRRADRRPYLYGLGLAGSEGVGQILKILRKELEIGQALTGRPSVASLDPSLIW